MLQAVASSPAGFPGVFRPEVFFMGETRGAAVAPRRFGPVQRCFITTQGWDDDASGTMHFDEIYRFDDGREDRMCWALKTLADGGLDASEVSVVGKPRSTLDGPCWRIRFKRVGGGGPGGAPLLYDARFHLVSPDTVIKRVTVSLLGLPLATMNGFHRKVPS